MVALDHTGVHVTDLERSIDFYVRMLGLSVEARFDLGAEHLAFLKAGNGWLELIEDGGPARVTGTVDHVALRVLELDRMVADLREAGVALLDPEPVDVPQIAARIVFCLGPDGERVELIQRA